MAGGGGDGGGGRSCCELALVVRPRRTLVDGILSITLAASIGACGAEMRTKP